MTDKKYLDKMEWQPNTIYYVKAISRNAKFKPRTWPHEGKYGEFWTTDVKVAIYNTVDKKYTEVGLFQFMIPKSILNEVQHKVDVDMPFYLRKSSGFNKEGKTIAKYNIYNTPEEIVDVIPLKKTPIDTLDKIPFDDDMGDDEVAFKENLVGEKVTVLSTKKTEEDIYCSVKMLEILENIEVHIGDTLGILQLMEKYLEEIATCFTKMLDKFSVKIKKVKE